MFWQVKTGLFDQPGGLFAGVEVEAVVGVGSSVGVGDAVGSIVGEAVGSGVGVSVAVGVGVVLGVGDGVSSTKPEFWGSEGVLT